MKKSDYLDIDLMESGDSVDISKISDAINTITKECYAGVSSRNADYNIGTGSYAHGVNCVAEGSYSHAEGIATKAISNGSHAEGYCVVALGDYSHAEGYADGDDGGSSIASGKGSHVEGCEQLASGNFSHCEGSHNTASGGCSHAEGSNNSASGFGAHVTGYFNTASGDFSACFGQYNEASGDGSACFGDSCEATGENSFVVGTGNKLYHPNVVMFGHYGTVRGDEDSYVGSSYKYGATDATAFNIGNGTGQTRSSAFHVLYNGHMICASSNLTGADYAEYFEWLDGNADNEDRVGYFVTMDGEKIKKASPGDYILGVVSGMPAVLGNHDNGWMQKFVTDEWGRPVYEDVTFSDRKGKTHTSRQMKINPEYNPEQTYTSRANRQEWDAIGMLGVLSVRDDGTCHVNGFCDVAEGGTATSGSTYRVISRVSDNVVKVVFK